MSADELTPRFYGGIVLVFPAGTSINELKASLPQKATYDIFDDCLEVTYLEVRNHHSWYVDSLLTELFAHADVFLLQTVCEKHCGRVLIDILFDHYGDKFPALLFNGKNMHTIQELQAAISIDTY